MYPGQQPMYGQQPQYGYQQQQQQQPGMYQQQPQQPGMYQQQPGMMPQQGYPVQQQQPGMMPQQGYPVQQQQQQMYPQQGYPVQQQMYQQPMMGQPMMMQQQPMVYQQQPMMMQARPATYLVNGQLPVYQIPATYNPMQQQRFNQAMMVFRAADRNRSGTLDRKEFKRLLKHQLGWRHIKKHVSQQLFWQVDRDRSGKITEYEFCLWWAGYSGPTYI